MRAVNIREISVKSAISRSSLPEYDYAVNPYSGCLHGCRYCFAIDFTMQSDARVDWGGTVYVKKNLPEILDHQTKSMRRGLVGISTVTDPYIYPEATYRLTRQSLIILLSRGFRVSLQTKSPLVLRDIDLISRYQEHIDVGFTITSMNREVTDVIEPYAPSPASRLHALERLSMAGIRTWIFIGPIIEGVNDSEPVISEIVEAASRYSSRIIFDFYNEYAGSSALLKGLIPERSVKMGKAGLSWKKGIMDMFRDLSARFGVEVNLQSEEWLRRPAMGKLF